MGTSKRFSKEFKEAIVRKLLSRGNQTIPEFCNNNNVALSTVSRWQSECANVLGMKTKKDKSKYSAEKILKIISETYSLNEEDLGIYLRKNGLHSNQLTEWRSGFLSSMNQPKVNPNKKDHRDAEIKDLKKNLHKKNAALAEVSALLILQKKANLLWPSPNEDEDT
jgi:transposase